ncbi:ABC transporter ATP-binding protein [Ornithinibacillus halotolerans]|uniref:Peptide ABC transporter ATP-binding protein n=1 Tax=Ornithinibacillus halotolerans TaxID=1274357 RepID=A0A916RPJ3_9BACI|nr:ABC transporter ATP-binding protein [Ornithinibacillus halotolerans]GGA63424.1 peptide ABC transporter ATP-binding protein [Ornithinibacillus halotolerans]
MAEKLLEIKNLNTSFRIRDDYYAAVDDVSLTVNKNEVLAIVGESGCGKSALAFSIMGLHNRTKMEGEILFKGENIVNISPSKLNKLRGKSMGMIFQDPLTALNPLMIIGDQIGEALLLHNKELSKTKRKEKVIDLLNKVGIPRAEHVYEQFPHELSGGMRQRVVIATAIANEPELLIADEPTTALDVTIQSQILDLIKDLKEDMNSGVVLITHDLGVVAEMADRVAVMYAGQLVEIADVHTLFEEPLHPYTKSLFNSVPNANEEQEKLHVIQGIVPSLQNLPRTGCRFAARIPWIDASQHEEHPELHEVKPGHFVRCSCYKHFHFPEESKEEQHHGIS